ncbi:MAG: hypothetical protein ABI777_14455 [Betaproteobacteria bacterium]
MNRHPKLSSIDLNLLVVFDATFKDRNITVVAGRRAGQSQHCHEQRMGAAVQVIC